jgi:subfamily B ATP-binding cassette protein MsbA
VRTFLRTLRYLRPYFWLLSVAFVCAIIVTILGLAFPWVVMLLIDDVFVNKTRGALSFVCLAFCGIAVLSALFGLVRHYLFTRIGESAAIDLRTQLFEHIQSQALQYLAREKTGRLMSHFTADAGAMQQLYTSTMVDAITNGLRIVVTLVVLFRMDVDLALLSVGVLPVFGLCVWAFGKPLRRSAHRVQESMASTSARLQESLAGIREVKAFTQEERQREGLVAVLHERLRALLRQAGLGASSAGLAHVTATFGSVAVLWVGSLAVIDGDMTAGALIAFVTYLNNLYGPTAWFVRLNVPVQMALAGADRVFAVLDSVPAIQDSPGARELSEPDGELAFRDVSYAYDTQDVIRHVSFTARPGEMVALVGPSGSGKTTLMNLIPRFADPRTGEVRLDGHDLRELTQASLRAHIGQVFQDPFLFSGTIAENILLGRPDAAETEIRAAAEAANAHDFIMDLPEGYRTTIGERGVRLSGGQRQRLAIARAILRNPRVLLLDETTSSLDSESEAAVQDALSALMVGRTSLVIAHRLSTVLHADRILVLDDGKLVASGSHSELLTTSPLYSRLYEQQFSREDREPASAGYRT